MIFLGIDCGTQSTKTIELDAFTRVDLDATKVRRHARLRVALHANHLI